ncbi:hypothetical protein LWI28_008927 [Acer negundo]|uniref:Uncharacterized protein n=1 Tax=Acer negundo TaxID=4023 RepID=A0AAD5ICG3_ACENE|nr:hypothetical protein LWI28_006433 [Acer negundo]KAI9160519.1 hypothetical protein LWI28_008927 [Acer negundo]
MFLEDLRGLAKALVAIGARTQFLKDHRDIIRAVVGNSIVGADAALIESLPKLEIVATCSVGLDKIDLPKCIEKGISVTNTPDVLTEEVADLAIGLILAVLRRLCDSDRHVRSGKWKEGEYQLTTKRKPDISSIVKSLMHWVLSNIGRGTHVDERELVSALVEGRLGGAGLDVFEHEPEVPKELSRLENVVFTPHVGSGTMETRKAMSDLVLGNLEAHFLNKPLLTPVV